MCRRFVPAACAALLLTCWAHGAEPLIVPIWPGDAPGSEGIREPEKVEERGKGVVDRAILNVHQPKLTVYLPGKAKSTGVAILLAPGGGYHHLAIDKEGHDVARWLNTQGIAGIVMTYRLPKTEGRSYTVDTALADAGQALKVVRGNAAKWGIDPARVGMMGFSAGGNLAGLAGTKLAAENRPSFLALIYPSIPESFGPIPAGVPPTFLVHADDDKLSSENSIRFYLGAKKQGVPAEMHVFSKGGHGFGIRQSGLPVAAWPKLFTAWLGVSGILPAAGTAAHSE